MRVGIYPAIFSFWAAILFSPGCDYGRMSDQESIRPYETRLPPMPEGPIPREGGIETLRASRPDALRNPLPSTASSLNQGKQAYGHYCIMCHGPRGDGNGTVGQSFAPLPSNLGASSVQGQSDGELFYKISLGFGRHPPLADTVSEGDRWAVIHYLRSLRKVKP
ncbi:MAG: cytochrome c [Syntrophaceae bacterium]|nr:cytochrome c [Syntrophaceae bacterium]